MVLESNTLDVLFVKDGQQGEDGKILYTWIKYAKDANGIGMTDDPNGAVYIGISYNNESSTESNDPKQYAWTKIQGADGKKGEDAYTIFLENENISFATDENRDPLSEQAYTSGITVMKGAKPVTNFTIGDIAKTQGIAVAKTDTAIAISVINGNPLPSDNGAIEIPITVGGTVFKKILSWTCAKKGDKGERGLQGLQGPQGEQGIAGEKGTNGKTTYFHIKYSAVANPTSSSQLTETPSTYIGTYVDFIETDSTDPKKYTWSQFVGSQGPKGEQGIAGVGVDGKTSYLHIAYANSADGKTGFSVSDSANKSYIGQYTDFTPNDSTDYTKYSWSLIRGKDGTDGVSPTVSVTKNGTTTTITITDKNGTHTQTVKDGTDGTPGQTGKDGKTTYFHVKYSNDGGKTFTSNSGEDVGTYIGTCTDYTQADPTTVGSYTWARIKGEKGDQGVQGDKGDNAKNLSIIPSSQYFKSTDGGKTFAPNTITIKPTIQGEISFGKWQYSIDGGVSFADVVSGQKGLTISNNVLSVSKDSSLYSDAVTMVTFRAVANDSSFYDTCSIAKIYDVSDIGDGRNLLWNSNFAKTDEAINTVSYTSWGLILRGNVYTATIDTSVLHNNFNTLKVIGTKAGENGGQDLIYRIKGLNLNEVKFTTTGTRYTLSFYAKASTTCNFSVRYAYDSYGTDTNVALSTDWKRYEIQMHPTTTSLQTALIFKMDAASTVWFSEFKLEKGSSATGYSTAPEDVQTAILSTKSEISDVSSQVDKNKQAIEQRVTKITYEQDLTLVKGDISKANEGLNKWRYDIYPKSLFASKYQGKSTMDVFAKNTNLTPSQSVLINDADFGKSWAYGDNYIGYALSFVKFSAAKSVSITFKHDDGAHLYLNGKLVGGDDTCNTGSGQSLTLSFVQGWNCLEVVLNEKSGGEYIGFGTTISALSECQLMNCYYGTPVARQSHIINQLVQNTTDIEGVTTKVGKVTSVIGEDGKNFTDFKNDYSEFKQTMNGFKTTVGQTYVTKSDFDGLEIGGRNLLWNSGTATAIQNSGEWNAHGCTATGETRNNCLVSRVNSPWNGYQFNLKKIIERYNLVDGDILTYSIDVKMDEPIGILFVKNYYADNKSCTGGISTVNLWGGEYFTIGKWERLSFTFKITQDTLDKMATDTYKQGVRIAFELVKATSDGKYVYFACPKLERGTKATDYTIAPEDNEINGQNLVSNLPSNWEQGSFVVEDDSKNKTYSEVKVSEKTQIRIKELIPVSDDITISAQATQNSSKEALGHYVMLFDSNKRYMGKHNVNGWNTSFPRMFNCGDAKYIAIALKWGDGTKTQITPSDISQICIKIERGTSATPFTLAPEDVNGKIVNVETIANQTAKEFSWIVKGGDKSSSMVLTDDFLNIVANNINLTGKVTFNSFDQSLKDNVSITSGNLITITPANPKSEYDSVAYSVDIGDRGEKCIKWTTANSPYLIFTSYYTPNIFRAGDRLYYDLVVPNWSSTITTGLGVWFYDKNKTYLSNKLVNITLAGGQWNHITGYIDMPAAGSSWNNIYYYNLGIENKGKAIIGLCSSSYIEKTSSYATTYASSAVNWVTNNGSSTTSLNSMVKKWTDGAVSDTTQINGGWIKANTITAGKIAVGDFTNYADINESNTYWFLTEQTKEGTWFYRDGSALQRDNVISELHTCRGGETFYVEYDISNTIKEGDEYKYAGLMIFGYDGNGGIVSYNRNAGVTATANGEITHITTQLTMPDTTRSFRVYLQIEGHVPFTGTLKIRNISVRKAVTGAVIVDGSITADKIATDAIKSRNYISSGGTQGSFLNLSDGSFTSPNLSWDSNGNLIASNANIIGNLTAGTVGEWKIDKYIYSKDKVFFDINKHNGQSIYNKNSTNNLFLGDGKISSFYWFTTQNNTFIIENGSSPQYATGPAGISFGTNITQGQIELYESVYPGNIIQDYEQTSHTSALSISGSKISFRYYDSNGSSFSDSPYTYIMADYARFYGDVFVQGGIGTDEGVDVGGKLQASSIAAKNGGLIETAGTVYGGGEIQCGGGQMRIIGGNYGILLRNDGSDFYILSTDSGSQWGSWNSKRPFRINLANGIPYFEYGIIIPNENYLIGNGYQIGRGTSWGGVCIGDDSQQLRLYGSSIWASHGISTSDENLKENFTTLDQYEDFYMNLNPIGFNYIGDYDGKKTHFGFGAHKTEDLLESEGYDADKFAVVTHRPLIQEDIEKRFGKDVEVDIETEYGVSYTEFIALNTHMIQKTRRELEQTKQEKADLEARLQAIEAKLGL